MTRSCSVIINPTSGSYSFSLVAKVLDKLRKAGFTPQLLETGGAGDAALFARRLMSHEENPFIVAAGGDGTINGVLNGLLPGRAVMAILPLGTSNVLAREIGIRSVEDAIARIVAGKSRWLPVGLAETDAGCRYFMLMAGVGFDGAVVERVSLAEKRFLKQGAYVLSALRLFMSWDLPLIRVQAGDASLACHSVIACNASRYGGSFVLAPKADLFEPGFQIACIREATRRSYLWLATRLAVGKPPDDAIHFFTAREIVVSGNSPIQLDGDHFSSGNLRISTVPEFVKLII